MNYNNAWLVGSVCLAFNLLGCSSGRDVEVTGKISAPSTVPVGDKLVVEFVDVVGEGDATEKTVAHSVELKALGDFKETVALEGDKLIVRAIDDRDGDGKCTAGEAWAEAEASIAENKADAIMLMLGTAACPAEVE